MPLLALPDYYFVSKIIEYLLAQRIFSNGIFLERLVWKLLYPLPLAMLPNLVVDPPGGIFLSARIFCAALSGIGAASLAIRISSIFRYWYHLGNSVGFSEDYALFILIKKDKNKIPNSRSICLAGPHPYPALQRNTVVPTRLNFPSSSIHRFGQFLDNKAIAQVPIAIIFLGVSPYLNNFALFQVHPAPVVPYGFLSQCLASRCHCRTSGQSEHIMLIISSAENTTRSL